MQQIMFLRDATTERGFPNFMYHKLSLAIINYHVTLTSSSMEKRQQTVDWNQQRIHLRWRCKIIKSRWTEGGWKEEECGLVVRKVLTIYDESMIEIFYLKRKFKKATMTHNEIPFLRMHLQNFRQPVFQNPGF